MELIKNDSVVNYESLDKEIATEFNAVYTPDTFCILPNNGKFGELVSMDWFELINQAYEEGDARTYGDVVTYYYDDYAKIIELEKVTLRHLIPQLFKLIEYFKENHITIK